MHTLRASFLLLIPSIALSQGAQLPKYTVATLPNAFSVPSYTVQVLDGITQADCTVGGATGSAAYNVVCTAHDGSWIPVGGSGGGGNISGSGTANHYAMFTGTASIGNGHIDDGVTTAGIVTSSIPFTGVSGNNTIPGVLGINNGSSNSFILGVGALCPNVSTSTVSGCDINVGTSQGPVNGAAASFRYRYFGSSTTNRGSLAMSNSGLPNPSYEWDLAGDSFFPQLVSVGCLGTDSNGKLGAGTGCSGIALTTTGTSGAATLTSGTLNIPQYQGAITLTTTGTSGAATLSGSTLNIPNYASGSGTVSGQVSGVIPLGTSATAISNVSHLDDGNTTPGTITSTEPLAIAGSTHGITIPAGTAVSGATGSVVYAVDATSGFAEVNENNTGLSRICTAGNAVCVTGGSVNVNGSSVSSPNFNNTTPAAGTNGKNVTWQVSGSSVSAEVVGDGVSTHYLDGTGNYTTPAGGGGGGDAVQVASLPIAICQSTTAGSGLSLPASNNPTALCATGTNSNTATLHYPALTNTSAQFHFQMPSDADCTQAMGITINWRTAGTTNSVIWSVQTQFTAAGSILDGSWNTANTVTSAASGTTEALTAASISSVTKTGCAAGSEAQLLLQRNGSVDTLGSDAEIISVLLTYSRSVGSGGGTFSVNGSSISNPNLNGTTPAAPGGNVNVTFQVSGGSVSAYVPNTTTSSPFSSVTSGTNTSAAMVLGSGSSLSTSGTGTNAATSVGGVTPSGTPSTTGQACISTSSSACSWQTTNPPSVLALTFVADGGTSVASITSPSVTVTAGRRYVIGCRFATGSSSVGVATDSLANTWTPLTAQLNTGSTTAEQMSWMTAASSGSDTFTCTPTSSSAGQAMVVMEVSNSNGTAAGNAGANNNWTLSSFTSTARGLFIQCIAINDRSPTGVAAGNILGTPAALIISSSGSIGLGVGGDLVCQTSTRPQSGTGGVAPGTITTTGSAAGSATTIFGLSY